ncbi:hypothetical protein VIGAN_01310600, partial [Vigna angularis var. angularis]
MSRRIPFYDSKIHVKKVQQRLKIAMEYVHVITTETNTTTIWTKVSIPSSDYRQTCKTTLSHKPITYIHSKLQHQVKTDNFINTN